MSAVPPPLEARRRALPSGPHPDPAALFARAAGRAAFVWEKPREGVALVGIGVAHEICASGSGRFAAVDAEARALFARLVVRGEPAPPEAGPLLMGGFAFGDEPCDGWPELPPAWLVLPQLLVVRRGARAWAVTCGPEGERENRERELGEWLAPGDGAPAPSVGEAPQLRVAAERPHAHYLQLVTDALAAIGAGELEKVVPARALRVAHSRPQEPAALLAELRQRHPSSTLYAISRGGATFLGATPEQLVALRAGRVATAAVAGSAPRGLTPEQDAERARALRESKKEQAEHAVVVRALREALEACCAPLAAPEAPSVLPLEGIQHLATPLVGRLRADCAQLSVLALAERLHPTPAVAGAPRAAALEWLARHEDLDRGWYGGPVGWVAAGGEGELCVALRCAWLRGGEARLFAGAGVVEGSQPESELRETRLKLRALLGPLLEL